MTLDDEYGLLETFNDACYEMARALQDGVANKYIAQDQQEFVLGEMVGIDQVEDWWTISFETEGIPPRQDFFTSYVEQLKKLTKVRLNEYFDGARTMLRDFNIYSSHFDAKLERVAAEELPEKIRYLPHVITYLDNVFESHRGYEVLKAEMAKEGLEPKIYFTPTEPNDRNSDNLNLDTNGVYKLVLIGRKTDYAAIPTANVRLH